MRGLWCTLSAAIGTMLIGGSADACVVEASINLNDVRNADVVVVGRIANYQLVKPSSEEKHGNLAAPSRSVKTQDLLDSLSGSGTNYARFDILVDEVLRGPKAKTLKAVLSELTFSLPAHMPSGFFVIALHNSAPPLDGSGATALSTVDPAYFSVLQQSCAGAFIFETNSGVTAHVRQILEQKSP